MKPSVNGFSYTEALVATTLIAILLVPALESMQSSVQGSGVHYQLALRNYRMLAKMEETLARPYAELMAAAEAVGDPNLALPVPYSDPAASEAQRLVFASLYDGDNADADNDPFTGTDGGLLWVRVIDKNSQATLETLRYD